MTCLPCYSTVADTATTAGRAKTAKAVFALVMLADVAKTFVGSRVRQLRSERGFSQAALAQMLEISPSYLNQIEHDVRPLTVAVLLRITEVFGVDATFFASQDDTRLVAELREVTMDRDLDIDVDPAEIADIVNAHPTLARAMVNLHRRYRITTTQLAAATEDRFSDGSGSGVDHDAARGGARLLLPATELSARARHRRRGPHHQTCACTAATSHAISPTGSRRCTACTSSDAPTSATPCCTATTPTSKRLEIGSHLSSGQTGVQDGRRTGLPRIRRPDRQTRRGGQVHQRGVDARWPGSASPTTSRPRRCCRTRSFTTSPRSSATTSSGSRRSTRSATRRSRTGCRRCSGRPCAACRSRSSGSTGQGTCQSGSPPRVFTSRPAAAPVRCGMSTRRSPTRARSWCRSPQMPDGRSYMWVARTVERRASRYGQPGKTFAIGLGCELRHAHRLVYSEGLDLSGDIATPIGAGCRVCERDNCPQRAFPALGRALDIDEHRSTVSPYLVSSRPVSKRRPPAFRPGRLSRTRSDQLGDRQAGRADHPGAAVHPVQRAGPAQAAVPRLAALQRDVARRSEQAAASRTPRSSSCASAISATASTNCSSTAGWPEPAASDPNCRPRSSRVPTPKG